MQDILFHYQKIHPMNWVYLSSLLMIGLYFKFSRFWSMRNADLIGLILLAPGLVLVEYGRNPPPHQPADPNVELAGFIWLFVISGIFLIRMLTDSMMVRRPLLEPNLSVGGMTWLGVSLLIFLLANVANSNPVFNTRKTADAADKDHAQTAHRDALGDDGEADKASQNVPQEKTGLQEYGPRFPMLSHLPQIQTQTYFAEENQKQQDALTEPQRHIVALTKAIAILTHLAIIVGLVVIGYSHFDNIRTGVAAAVLYLLLPYTAEMTGHIDHCLPAAFIVWAIALYRRPLAAGVFFGLAMAAIYYPLFLLPLWISFYWQRGMLRFCVGVAVVMAVSIGVIAIYTANLDRFVLDLRQMLGLTVPRLADLKGIWVFVDPYFRLPIIATFVALGGGFALWPAQKNLGTLLSGTAALMLGAQFWHGEDGGLCMAWYLPLLLLTIFRPNLEDRVALSVLSEGWLPGRRSGQSESRAA
jgi:ABC-type proline/glycine betaine transport system permease subunit